MNDKYISTIKEKCYIKNGSLNCHTNKQSWWETNDLVNIYNDIMLYTSFLEKESKMPQRIFHYIFDIPSIPICNRIECNNPKTWNSHEYGKYCSRKCNSIDNVETRKKTSLERYGVDNPSKSKEVIEKIKKTTFENYGVTNFSLTDSFKDSIKQQWKDNKEKWLHEREQSNVENYGWKTPFESSEVSTKVKNTMLERYGTTHPLQIPEVLDRMKNTNISRYGVESYLQKDIDPIFLNNRNNREWLLAQLELSSLKQMAINYNVSYTLICQTLNNADISIAKHFNGEKEIYDFIKTIYNGTIIKNTRKVLDKKELDIYIPDMKIAIEHNGTYWHNEKNGKDRLYHLQKTKECESKGIRLIHIFENEWIDKQDIVKSILSSSIGVANKIYARKCNIKNVEPNEEKKFLTENHIQGYIPSTVCLGLYYNDELVQLMSFGKPRFTKKYECELLRLASKINNMIIGGANKLIAWYMKQYDSTNIISYCDRRLFSGKVYERMNFVHSHYSDPGYFYVDQYGKLHNRLKFQKKLLQSKLKTFDPNITENQNMINNGYNIIWDCGNSVWVLTRKELC